MELSEQIKDCLDGKSCEGCEFWEGNTKVTCRNLLRLAYGRIRECEDLEEQCVKENSFGLRMLLHKWKEFTEDIHELYEYRKLEEQGKLLKLPFAVGDTVYIIVKLPGGGYAINETVADAFTCALSFLENTFERNLFLTREEAKAALEKMKMMGNNINWLMTTPSTDCNFKSALKRATDEEIKTVMKNLSGKKNVKAKLKELESELKRRERGDW